MNPDRWKQIDDLLEAVMDLDTDKRSAFLDDACAGDDTLRKEIEILLISDQRSASFIDVPALHLHSTSDKPSDTLESQGVYSLLDDKFKNEKALQIGQTLAGRYRILARLGRGGMGDVWKAYDLKLRVDVALKALRSSLIANPEFLRAEVRSAREVISPNVCRIFDLIEVEDQEFTSMEYIDGMTLLSFLQQKGPIGLNEARDIALQFLAGLEAIHRADLVHCDLKPENIMITRTGRVVVMDFGIAKDATQIEGPVSGTLPYMAPERLSQHAVDVRSDIFSAGVILAELIHPQGIISRKTREEIWHAIHKSPQQLFESPWKAVIARAVAYDPEFRFTSAQAFSRALEYAIKHTERKEEREPYPGLASFNSADSEYFFGRELEVENVLQRLSESHLIALIGASGSGKTSFLRAGLIPARPLEWNCIFFVPGDSPLINLRQALEQNLSSEKHNAKNSFQIDDASAILQLLRLWRKKHAETVLIVDRFEELFTLNTIEAQSEFTELIGKAALDADVRVLLSLRDDFLMRCHEYSALAPMFSELIPLGSLTGPALRRALEQPALKCGCRFEDESLLDDILMDVEKERSALPLMAFAAAELWDKRDRNNGQLTRKSYLAIGGIAGALARHAEDTMERIGDEKQTIVREIFRNLVTAENTRVARDTKELLTVFANRKNAEEVLGLLIDARLLTSFEVGNVEDENRKTRVEIVHESLLTAWPRLVRWQAQDADGALLRDQLRQSAQLWEQRSRSEDLLWTGSAFLEYQAWRQRYSGRLTTSEEAFTHAMVQRTGRKKRQRQLTLVVAFIILAVVTATISVLWRNASLARDEAVRGTRRAEAGRILAIARALHDADPSTMLAYALRSLELADNVEARMFAMQAISQGPTYHALDLFKKVYGPQVSPNNKWIAVNLSGGRVSLIPSDGSGPLNVNEQDVGEENSIPWYPQFSPDSDQLVWTWRKNASIVKVFSISQKKLIRTFNFEGLTICLVHDSKAFFITDKAGKSDAPFFWHDSVVRVWDFSNSQPEILGYINLEGALWKNFDIDSQGRWIGYSKDNEVFIRKLDPQGIKQARSIGKHLAQVRLVRFDPIGKLLASADTQGEIRLWSLEEKAEVPIRIIPGTGQGLINFWFDAHGTSIIAPTNGKMFRWDLTVPDNTEPFNWKGSGNFGSFDNTNRMLSVSDGSTIYIYDDPQPAFYELRGKVPRQGSSSVRFTSDRRSFIGGFTDEGIHVYKMPGGAHSESLDLGNSNLWLGTLETDSFGRYVAVPTAGDGMHLISIEDSRNTRLKGLSPYGSYNSVAFSEDGKSLAASISGVGQSGIEVWDLLSGSSRILNNNTSSGIIKYLPDGTLISGDSDGKLRRWNLQNNSATILNQNALKGEITGLAVTHDGRFIATSTTLDQNSELRLYDFQKGTSSIISSHGNRVLSVAFDLKATKLVTGDYDGIVRVGPINGGTPNLLLGHIGPVGDVVVHPDGKWILSSAVDNPTIRLWRVPEGKPLQAFSNEEFQKFISEKTNVRVVADQRLPGGYRMQLTPFLGWRDGIKSDLSH